MTLLYFKNKTTLAKCDNKFCSNFTINHDLAGSWCSDSCIIDNEEPHLNIKKLNYKLELELYHLASADYCEMNSKYAQDLPCGSVAEHLKINKCPRKQGKIGDSHFELYVRQNVIIRAINEDQAENNVWDRSDINSQIDKYLNSKGITEFSAIDMEGDIIQCSRTNLAEKLDEPISITHENVYFD